jgi:hypothetical protein
MQARVVFRHEDFAQKNRHETATKSRKWRRVNQGENQEGVESSTLIGELLGKVNAEVVQLDTIRHNKYTWQPEKLRVWQSASRVERAPQREKKPATLPAE